jgi:GT2 family glycosyltransferase
MMPPLRRTARDITIVIPTLGRHVLRQALEALERGTVWPARVIVVDQGRRPDIAVALDETKTRSFDTLWLPSSETGRAAGINRGIERAQTRFVAVTDDDCLVQGDWLERLMLRLLRNPDAIVTGRVEAGDETVVLVVTDRDEAVQRRPALRFDRLIGANMALATALMHQLGGLDEDRCLRTAEDGEFAYRALRAGVPIVYAPEVVVTHLAWRDEQERSEQYQSYARSQGGFYGKYLRRGDVFIAARAGVHMLRSLRRWVLGTLRRQHEASRLGRAYALGLLPGIVDGWRSGAAPRATRP